MSATERAPLKEWCLERLAFHEGAAADPLANPVRSLAHELAELEMAGEIDRAMLAALARDISDDAFAARADAFGAAHRVDAGDPGASVADALRPLEGRRFSDVKAALERARAGIVFTAHPTFALSRDMRAAFAARAAAACAVVTTRHAPDEPLTLAAEHEDAANAIARAQDALRDLIRAQLVWARERFPERWRQIAPAPLSLATWVGYDLDGRTDIHWADTFRIRLEEKSAQLFGYARRLDDSGARAEPKAALAQRLRAAGDLAREQAAMFKGDFSSPERVIAAANCLTGPDPRRLVSLDGVIAEVDALGERAGAVEQLDLATLRAEMKNCGLGLARIHLRVNAAQLSSALRADLHIDSDRDIMERSTLEAAAAKAAGAAEKRVNFASIFNEQMTARRQFMLCAEFLKHIDADTPIRFLIAECEAPATVMGAVYLARLYGVDHRLDISPLFETPEAIERGGRFVERLLAEPEYVAYVRSRGRIAIQAGFSDSGRFMGQAPANLGIERLQILASRALAAAGVTDVEAVVFNTHGESMGRGGFPGGLNERFDWVMSPWARARYAHDRIALCAETSFQGGDGYLHFETAALARATVAALFDWSVAEPQVDREDRYYRDINYSWDVYRAVKGWQEQLLTNPDYQASVGAFGAQLLFSTGSRRAKRQGDSSPAGLRAIRAIPHNAILQQLALPVNVFGGLGSAAGGEIERFIEMVRASPRMQGVMALAGAARAAASLPALRSYASLYDSAFWIGKAAGAPTAPEADRCEALAFHLKDHAAAWALGRLADHAAADLQRFDRLTERLGGAPPQSGRRALDALHATRQALMQRAFMIVAALPAFSSRHDITRASLFKLAFELRLDDLADLLATIFPAGASDAAQFAGLDEPGDPGEGAHGYPQVHAEAIGPLRDIHRLLREIGVGLSHFYGAYG